MTMTKKDDFQETIKKFEANFASTIGELGRRLSVAEQRTKDATEKNTRYMTIVQSANDILALSGGGIDPVNVVERLKDILRLPIDEVTHSSTTRKPLKRQLAPTTSENFPFGNPI